MERLQARVARAADNAVQRAKMEVLGRAADAGVSARTTGQGVELSGRGLWRRVLADARLRWLGRGGS